MSEFKYVDAVKRVLVAAQARIPRLQPEFIREIGDVTSQAVARGDWVQIGEDVSTHDGMTPEGFVDDYCSTRPFGEIPQEVTEIQDDTWTSGNLSKQSARWTELRAVYHQKGKIGDDLASAALAAEAALYGTKPGSTKPGIAPGTKPADVDTGTGPRLAVSTQPSDNPWSVSTWRGTEEMRLARIQSIIKTSASLAASMAEKANVTLSGRPRQAVKGY